jgi:hypothetical protein
MVQKRLVLELSVPVDPEGRQYAVVSALSNQRVGLTANVLKNMC